MPSSTLEEAATALGLAGRSSSGTFYGEVDGFLVQLAAGLPQRSDQVLALIRFDADGRAEDVAKALGESLDLAPLGILRDDVSSDSDSVVLTFPPSVLIGAGKAYIVEPRVRAVLDVVRRAVRDNRKACRNCGTPGGEAALFEGEVARLCANCIEGLEHQAEVAESFYEAYPVNVPRAVAAAVVAGAAGAALYGSAMIATNHRLSWLAILIGTCVGWAAVTGAGKTTSAIQAMAAAIAFLSVVAAVLLFIAYAVNEQAKGQGLAVDWIAFLRAAPGFLVANVWAALFSIAGGLVGARYAIRQGRRPDFTVVERTR